MECSRKNEYELFSEFMSCPKLDGEGNVLPVQEHQNRSVASANALRVRRQAVEDFDGFERV